MTVDKAAELRREARDHRTYATRMDQSGNHTAADRQRELAQTAERNAAEIENGSGS